jgi:hypothetical protein
LPLTPFTIEWMRNWLLFVNKAAAYFGFIEKARQRVFNISSKLLSVSSGFLSVCIVNISTPSRASITFIIT